MKHKQILNSRKINGTLERDLDFFRKSAHNDDRVLFQKGAYNDAQIVVCTFFFGVIDTFKKILEKNPERDDPLAARRAAGGQVKPRWGLRRTHKWRGRCVRAGRFRAIVPKSDTNGVHGTFRNNHP
jgi:hypothetical protein